MNESKIRLLKSTPPTPLARKATKSPDVKPKETKEEERGKENGLLYFGVRKTPDTGARRPYLQVR